MFRNLLAREARLAARGGSGLWMSLMFFLLMTCLLAFAVGPRGDMLRAFAVPYLWVGVLLSSLLSLDRMFSYDMEDGTLARTMTSPTPIEALVVAKVLAHWAATGLPLSFAAPLFAAMLGVPPTQGIAVGASLLVGTVGASALGSFGASIAVFKRRGNLLLSAMVLPLFVPTLVFGVQSAEIGAGHTLPSSPQLLLVATSLATLAVMPFVTARVLVAHIQN
ncbi:MAG: heme exporter protein CcmB [Rhodobacteraceae bacterium]|nr:heme exporter protein CcmB [Paracoccaceae bacterium]